MPPEPVLPLGSHPNQFLSNRRYNGDLGLPGSPFGTTVFATDLCLCLKPCLLFCLFHSLPLTNVHPSLSGFQSGTPTLGPLCASLPLFACYLSSPSQSHLPFLTKQGPVFSGSEVHSLIPAQNSSWSHLSSILGASSFPVLFFHHYIFCGISDSLNSPHVFPPH